MAGTEAWKDKIAFAGHTWNELDAAFKRVSNPDDWRAPFQATVSYDDYRITAHAIIFFTGADAEIVKDNKDKRTVTIKAVGYRNGPCGP